MQTRKSKLANGKELTIREAEPEDASVLLDYVHAVAAESDFLSFGPGEFPFSLEEETEILRQYRQADNRIYLLGWVDDVLVSGLTLSAGSRPRRRHSGDLGMSVRKSHWRQGIGAQMLAAIIDWARENGIIKKINLSVRTDNLAAIHLYEKFGFIREGTIHKEIYIGGEYYDLYWMGLEL